MKSTVKTLVLCTTLAASLLAAFCAPAADQVQPVSKAAPPAPPSPAAAALQALLRELQRADQRTLPATVRMEKLAAQPLSAQTREQLRAAFGSERLYSLERQPAQAGRVDWRMTFPALRHAPSTDTLYEWNAGWIDFRFNPAGTTAQLKGGWGLLAAEDAQVRVAARGLGLESRQRRGQAGLWFGDIDLGMAGLDIRNKADGSLAALTGLGIRGKVSEKPDSADLAYDARIGRIEAGGERIDDLRFAMRLTNIDKAALAALNDIGTRGGSDMAALSQEQQGDAVKPLLRDFGKALLARGAALEIDEISAAWHGARASLKGRVAAPGARAADLDDFKSLAQKLVARFEVRVPAALVREIAGSIAAKQAVQQGKGGDAQTLAQLRQSVGDIAVGKLVGDGYARMDKEVLVSIIEWRDGALRANGKPLNLAPQAVPMPAQASAPLAAATPRANFLQARRIDGSCTLPAYPDEVVRADRPLQLAVRIAVGADGKVRHTAAARPSAYPDYDRAVLVALAQCRYAPALDDGKPVDMELPWQLVRTPGTTQP